jgi:hypothetical protein
MCLPCAGPASGVPTFESRAHVTSLKLAGMQPHVQLGGVRGNEGASLCPTFVFFRRRRYTFSWKGVEVSKVGASARVRTVWAPLWCTVLVAWQRLQGEGEGVTVHRLVQSRLLPFF